MLSWFSRAPVTPKKLSGPAFLALVNTGSMMDIQAQLDLGADPNEETVESWMDRVTPVGKSVDRGDLPIVLALLRAGGCMPEHAGTLGMVLQKHLDWIPSLAPLMPPDEKTIRTICFHNISTLDSFALHWDRATRQKLIREHREHLPQSLALERQTAAIEADTEVSVRSTRARHRP